MSGSKAGLLLVERVQVISFTTVEGALYGLAFALYISCARSLYLQLKDRDRRRQHLVTLLYMTLAMVLALFGVVQDACRVQASYVDHADYPGGGYAYSVKVFSKSSIVIVAYVATSVLSLMMFGIQIWRLWIVWKTSRYSVLIMVLPALSFLTYLGFLVATIAVVVRSELTPHLDRLFLYGEVVPPLLIGITVTVLIIARIVMIRRKYMKFMGQTDIAKSYTSIISMLVESFALESAWLIVQIVAFANFNPATIAISHFFIVTQPFIQLIAYLLVVYRVATGQGWREDTSEKLTTLQWNPDGLRTTRLDARASTLITYKEA